MRSALKRGMLLCTIVAAVAIVGMPAASAGGGCHSGVTQNDAGGEDAVTVRMVDACFTATVTTVDQGAPVTFVNMDEFVHNVGGNEWGHFEDLHGGDAFTVSFDEAGTYPFACSYHPGMTGAIVVGDGKVRRECSDHGRAVRTRTHHGDAGRHAERRAPGRFPAPGACPRRAARGGARQPRTDPVEASHHGHGCLIGSDGQTQTRLLHRELEVVSARHGFERCLRRDLPLLQEEQQ